MMDDLDMINFGIAHADDGHRCPGGVANMAELIPDRRLGAIVIVLSTVLLWTLLYQLAKWAVSITLGA